MTTIAIIGGSGPEGRGLGLRWAIAGHHIILGSRDAARGAEAAASLRELVPNVEVDGALNADAARDADWVVLSVPYEGLDATVADLGEDLAGKMVVSVVAPLDFKSGRPRAVGVAEGSAAELIQERIPEARVTSGFQNLSAQELLEHGNSLEGDVLVCGDDAQARADTMALADAITGLRGVDAGPLANSRTVEGLTALILHVNRQTKGRATIKLLGI